MNHNKMQKIIKLSLIFYIPLYVFISFFIMYILSILFNEFSGYIIFLSPILGPIAFLIFPVLTGQYVSHMFFIIVYIITSIVIGILIMPRLLLDDNGSKRLLFWAGIIFWFAIGFVAKYTFIYS